MRNSREPRSWMWHPGVAVLAAVVAIVGFVASMPQTLSDPPVTVAFVLAAAVALVTGLFLIVLAPMRTETHDDHKWWAIGTWLIGILATMFVLVEAKRPGGVLWPALILIVPWYYAVFRAIPPERASRPVRGILATCVVAIGAAVAPFAWSGNSPMPPIDGAAIGYLGGIAVAAVFLRAGESWLRVAAALGYAVSFMSLTSQFLPIVPVLLAAYLAYWIRRRRIGFALHDAAA
ncbi:MAG TPA: hypothetical protein VF344_00440 [Candidatus Limnocylindrales bacterium]